MASCDFCNSSNIAWRYPASSFPITQGNEHISKGAWDACDICYMLIESGDWEELAKRSLLLNRSMLSDEDPLDIEIADKTKSGTVRLRTRADLEVDGVNVPSGHELEVDGVKITKDQIYSAAVKRLHARFRENRTGLALRLTGTFVLEDKIATVLKHIQIEINAMVDQRPKIWQQLDATLQKKSQYQRNPVTSFLGHDGMHKNAYSPWPDWSFLPAMIYEAENTPDIADLPTRRGSYPEVAALGAWRQTQGVYAFDDALLQSLWNTPLEKLPVELLYHLPEFSVLVILPDGAFSGVGGVMAAMCQIQSIGSYPSITVLLLGGPGSGHFTIPLMPRLDDSIDFIKIALSNPELAKKTYGVVLDVAGAVEGSRGYVADILTHDRDSIAGLLSVLLYLCSEEPEISRQPPKPQATPTKKTGLRWFPPPKPTVVEVGYKIGAKLRLARHPDTLSQSEIALRSSREVMPHWRRAHYHLYWVGPRGNQTPKVRWLAPIPVLGGSRGAVVRPVDSTTREQAK